MNAADLSLAMQVAANYQRMAQAMKREAFLARVARQPMHARIYEYYARIAEMAAKSEEGWR